MNTGSRSRVKMKVAQSCLTLGDRKDYTAHGILQARNSPGKNTGMGRCSLLQGISLTQESNCGLLKGRFFTTMPPMIPKAQAIKEQTGKLNLIRI